MAELKSFLFRAYIRAYLSSGESFDLAERAQKHLLNLLTPLTSEIGLNVTSEIFDQYEDEIHEMKGIRQPIVSLHFEAHARTIDQLVDYNLFLRSLARLMDDQYSDIRVRYEPGKSAVCLSGIHSKSQPNNPQ